MGIDHYYTPTSVKNKDTIDPETKAKTMPAAAIYRPPPARKLCSPESSADVAATKKAKSKPRRPDIQVYVPRAKRASLGVESDSQIPTASDRRHYTNVPLERSLIKLTTPTKKNQQSDLDSAKISANISTLSTISPAQSSSDGSVQAVSKPMADIDVIHSLRTDTLTPMSVSASNDSLTRTTNLDLSSEDNVMSTEIIEQASVCCLSNLSPKVNASVLFTLGTSDNLMKIKSNECDNYCEDRSDNQVVKVDTDELCGFNISDSVEATEIKKEVCGFDISDTVEETEIKKSDIVLHKSSDRTDCPEIKEDVGAGDGNADRTVDIECCQINNVSASMNMEHLEKYGQGDALVDTPIDTTRLVEIIANTERQQKCDEDEEKCRISEEQNRKNRSINRGNTYMSDILLISDRVLVPSDIYVPSLSVPPSPSDSSLGKSKDVRLKTNESSPASQVRLNPDECTWDMMFDDSGECLDPFLMDELTSKVGNVTIKTPQSDYKSFATQDFQPRDEFSHVVEIYDFPAEFKTLDLISIFSSYQSKGFEIKWVDDTHALAVFSNAAVANEVLKENHPFLKTRPLHEAAYDSRAKARRSSEFLLPYRARPETCPAMARRMVTGALGVRLSTAKQEREAERALLKVAREKKKLEARQKDEAWEGTLGGTVNTTD